MQFDAACLSEVGEVVPEVLLLLFQNNKTAVKKYTKYQVNKISQGFNRLHNACAI